MLCTAFAGKLNEDVLRRARVKFDEMFAKPAAARAIPPQGAQMAKTGNKGAAKSSGKARATEAPREDQPPAKKVARS